MKILTPIFLTAALLPAAAAAQPAVSFEQADYRGIGVYDSWEASPFRTGQLQGNVQVVPNDLTAVDPSLGLAPNPSGRMLVVQRSRFGSNTFGARIDLKQPFELTPQTQYVHVLLHKPVEGRVMLIGLGKRRERAGQSPEAEQFWAFSSAPVVAGKWNDAVFPIKGAGGIDIYSLVVVPDCESPHALGADFVACIDEITVNADPAPRFVYGDYVRAFPDGAESQRPANSLRQIVLDGGRDGRQTLVLPADKRPLLYRDLTDSALLARAGDSLAVRFEGQLGWLNGFVYLDRGSDGRFDAALTPDGKAPRPGSDLLAFAYHEVEENVWGLRGQDGARVAGNDRNILNPPAFALPADLAPGFYRVRFKLDWGNADPAGRMTATNSIQQNGGIIVDTRLNVHGDYCNVNDANRNGEVLTADGQKLVKFQAPFGKPFTIRMNPENGFTYSGIRVRHGYGLAGDSVVHGTKQYDVDFFPAAAFRNDTFTIPGSCMDGEVEIEGLFIEVKKAAGADAR